MLAWLLILAGAAIAVPQVLSTTPWHLGLAIGVVLIVLGIARLNTTTTDQEHHR